MAKIRVERNKGYTVMSNYHLKDKTITLKSKGLLSMMLSLPDEWHYSTRGLAAICKEGVDAIGAALKELEKAGYIIRNQIRGERGRIVETEYVIYEQPGCMVEQQAQLATRPQSKPPPLPPSSPEPEIHPTPAGSGFSPLQGKQETSNYKLKDLSVKPVSEWIRIEDTHEAIIRKPDFDLVQKILQLDTRTAPFETGVHLFSGIIICGCCGARMTRKTVPYKEDTKYYYYRCPTGKKNHCTTPMIKEADLIDFMLEYMKTYIGNIITLDDLINTKSQQKIMMRLISRYMAQIKENRQELEKINKVKASLYENLVSGILTRDDYQLHRKQFAEEAESVKSVIEQLKQELEDVRNNTSERLKWMEHFKRFEDLQELDRKAVIQLVQAIKIESKTEIAVDFRYKDEYEQAVILLAEERKAV